jgi:type I restriction enzyme, S subunit
VIETKADVSADVARPLPEGWRWSSVELLGAQGEQTVLTGPFGADLGSDDFVSVGVPVLTIGCLTDRGLDLGKAVYVSEAKASELSRYRVRTGMSSSPAWLRSVAASW